MKTLLIIILFVLYIEHQFSPRIEYNEVESILIIFYSAKNGERRRKIFKL